MDIYSMTNSRETTTQFESILNEIQQPGLFACSGILNTGLPGITTNEVGTLGLPICEAQAKQLINLCSRPTNDLAPGPWELSPQLVQFSNPKWSETIAVVVAQAKHGLGVSEHVGIEARLHKLLLYEADCQSAMQQQINKQDGTFASLIIQLPSIYQGGHLIVCHQVGSWFNESSHSTSIKAEMTCAMVLMIIIFFLRVDALQ
jgi:hypothetical protein